MSNCSGIKAFILITCHPESFTTVTFPDIFMNCKHFTPTRLQTVIVDRVLAKGATWMLYYHEWWTKLFVRSLFLLTWFSRFFQVFFFTWNGRRNTTETWHRTKEKGGTRKKTIGYGEKEARSWPDLACQPHSCASCASCEFASAFQTARNEPMALSAQDAGNALKVLH